MKHNLVFSILFVSFMLALSTTKADLLDCTEEKFIPLSDFSGIGPKIADDTSVEQHQLRDFLKSVGCQIKKGASKVKEHAKKIGTELKINAKKWGEKAKDLGSDIKTKFNDFKQRIAHESDEDIPHRLFGNVEIINPDILKAEQICGHGHILDVLGNCSKLRK